MGTVKGPVLLDFSDGAVQWTQSGYRMENLVLTVASPNSGRIFQDLVDKTKKVADTFSLKIKCYQTVGDSVVVVENCKIRNVWTSTKINGIINEMSKSNLGPYAPNTKFSYTEAKFLLIELDNKSLGLKKNNTVVEQLSNHTKNVHLSRGQNVYTVYTPFGANEFINSCSKGCLSNTFKELLFLIDGRLAPGCEGAPVFTKADEKDQEYPIGMVLFPVAMNMDHSSYSLVVPMRTMITTMLESGVYPAPLKQNQIVPSTLISSLDENVPIQGAILNIVAVQTAAGWGSGIVIGPGLVLTNSHVIGFGSKSYNPIRVCWANCAVTARVVFCSAATSVLDIALLEYNKAVGTTGILFSNKPVEKGQHVIALGHPLHAKQTMPSISKGIILNYYEGSVGFTTSCIINAGSSGGAIVREDGTLIGIVVGIINAGTCPYPEMNVCISATLFEKPLLMYQSTGDADHWKALLSYEDPWLKALHSLRKCKY
uniref:Peroxisomal leader peptide-processing protease n=1 Tax=Lygus hesperus TaxID=30085 RepID=A0A0A9XGX7_LYGHE